MEVIFEGKGASGGREGGRDDEYSTLHSHSETLKQNTKVD
jgi:hypothetical protein